jgi:hypothetical protein
MPAFTKTLFFRQGLLRKPARLNLAAMLVAAAVLVAISASLLPAMCVLALLLGSVVGFFSGRFPWLGVASPVAVFSLLGAGIFSGVTILGAQINFIDVMLLPALAFALLRAARRHQALTYPKAAFILIVAWVGLMVATGIYHGNSPELLRNELHTMSFLPLAFVWAALEIRRRRDLWLMLCTIGIVVTLAGVKSTIVSFFVTHYPRGESYIWQALTPYAGSIGGSRTMLNGADLMFVVVVPILVAVALFAPRCRTSFWLLASSPFVIMGLLFSMTRTHWAAAIASMLLTLCLGLLKSGGQTLRAGLVLSATAVIVIVLIAPLSTGGIKDFGGLMADRLVPTDITGAQNIDMRHREADRMLEAAREHLLLGNGFGASIDFNDEFGNGFTTHTGHNGMAWLFFKSGIAGLILFYLAIAVTLKDSFQLYRRTHDWVYEIALLGTGIALVVVIAMSPLSNRLPTLEGAYFVGLAMVIPRLVKSLNDEKTRGAGYTDTIGSKEQA